MRLHHCPCCCCHHSRHCLHTSLEIITGCYGVTTCRQTNKQTNSLPLLQCLLLNTEHLTSLITFFLHTIQSNPVNLPDWKKGYRTLPSSPSSCSLTIQCFPTAVPKLPAPTRLKKDRLPPGGVGCECLEGRCLRRVEPLDPGHTGPDPSPWPWLRLLPLSGWPQPWLELWPPDRLDPPPLK